MKKLAAVAVLTLALAACGEAAEDVAEPEATETEAAASSTPGTYEFEVEGQKTVSVIDADGTYADSVDGKVTESGTWMDMGGKVCFNPEGDDTPEQCYTTTEPDEDGVFTATSDDGQALTIKKVS